MSTPSAGLRAKSAADGVLAASVKSPGRPWKFLRVDGCGGLTPRRVSRGRHRGRQNRLVVRSASRTRDAALLIHAGKAAGPDRAPQHQSDPASLQAAAAYESPGGLCSLLGRLSCPLAFPFGLGACPALAVAVRLTVRVTRSGRVGWPGRSRSRSGRVGWPGRSRSRSGRVGWPGRSHSRSARALSVARGLTVRVPVRVRLVALLVPVGLSVVVGLTVRVPVRARRLSATVRGRYRRHAVADAAGPGAASEGGDELLLGGDVGSAGARPGPLGARSPCEQEGGGHRTPGYDHGRTDQCCSQPRRRDPSPPSRSLRRRGRGRSLRKPRDEVAVRIGGDIGRPQQRGEIVRLGRGHVSSCHDYGVALHRKQTFSAADEVSPKTCKRQRIKAQSGHGSAVRRRRHRCGEVGDEGAWRELYAALGGRIVGWLRSQPTLDSPLDAEDLANEAWLTAARRIAEFNGSTDDFAGWIFVIARNLALNTARRSSAGPRLRPASTRVSSSTTCRPMKRAVRWTAQEWIRGCSTCSVRANASRRLHRHRGARRRDDS